MCFFGQNNLQLVKYSLTFMYIAPSITLTLFQSTPMYNGPSVHMTDRPFASVVHYQYVGLFPISLF